MATETIDMKKKKDCKHSIVFETDDENAAVSSVYVNRTVPGIDKAQHIRLTVEVP